MRTRSVFLLLVLLAAVSLVLGAGLAILIWSIPDNGGIGAGLLALGSITLVAAAGVVATVVLVGNLLPRTRGRVWPWALAGLAAWVVGPVYVGGTIGGTVDSYLDEKYSSPAFVADYEARLGVEITPQGQGFEYSGCTMQTYTATYRITAARDTDLMFGLADSDEFDITHAGVLPYESIAAQFEGVGQGYVPWSYRLGTFRVPAGTHVLTVKGKAPFLLAVDAPEPLWTPSYALHANWRFFRLYADSYTLAQVYAAAEPFHPASCPKICTRADIPMAADTPGAIAHIGGAGDEQPVDFDDDKHYDVLVLHVTLVVTRTGDYVLAGKLVDPTGQAVDADTYDSPWAEPLCTGVHTVTLSFSGQPMKSEGLSGPYTLTALTLDYVDPTTFEYRQIEKVDNIYTTRAYSWALFDGSRSEPKVREDRDFSDQRRPPPIPTVSRQAGG